MDKKRIPVNWQTFTDQTGITVQDVANLAKTNTHGSTTLEEWLHEGEFYETESASDLAQEFDACLDE